jgi:nitroreductase
MSIPELFLKRRSIRKFTDKKVEREKIEAVIKAAMYAPSAVNRQPWHFIVIDDKEILENILKVHSHANVLSTANCAVLVCGDENLHHDTGYYIADCGAATENLLLAATSIGLGSCWIGVYPRERRMNIFKVLFNLPQYVQPFALVALGYSEEETETPERFQPERIHLNTWAAPY